MQESQFGGACHLPKQEGHTGTERGSHLTGKSSEGNRLVFTWKNVLNWRSWDWDPRTKGKRVCLQNGRLGQATQWENWGRFVRQKSQREPDQCAVHFEVQATDDGEGRSCGARGPREHSRARQRSSVSWVSRRGEGCQLQIFQCQLECYLPTNLYRNIYSSTQQTDGPSTFEDQVIVIVLALLPFCRPISMQTFNC